MSKRLLKTLIVDDSAVTRGLLAETLAGLDGIKVVGTARDGEEGLRLAQTFHPDVVMLDLRMPQKGGIQVLPDLKAMSPAPTVIVLTNFPFSSYRRRCMEAGADYFFDKSQELHEAVALLRSWGGEAK